MSLGTVLDEIKRKLDEKDRAREEIINGSREIIRLTRQSVALIHQEKKRKAENLILQAVGKLKQLARIRKEYPELYDGGILTPAQQEIVEASILASLVEGKGFPRFEGDLISPVAYLLGMADAVGELRRLCLERLGEFKLKDAREAFSMMNEIYEALLEFDYPSGLTPGLRHKVDTARRLVEETRTDVIRAQLLLRSEKRDNSEG